MATKKKMLLSSAGTAAAGGGGGLDIDDVFSTYLYTGTGTDVEQTIVNGIDLTEGGMVWTKSRTNTYNNTIGDTASGTGRYLHTNTTVGHTDVTAAVISSFNSDGYKFGSTSLGYSAGVYNASGQDYVSWTWRKAPKFFDVVTYTGTNVIRTVSHNLGSVPGMIIVKRTDSTGAWRVYHRGSNATAPEDYYLTLNATDQAGTGGGVIWNDTAPTDSVFTVGANNSVNADGGTFVAYVFAHNNNDGEFGPDGDQDIIKCGSYTGTGAYQDIDVGFEPQWLLIKSSTATVGDNDWQLVDTMRAFEAGPFHDNGSQNLSANTTNAEPGAGQFQRVAVTPTGFTVGNAHGWSISGQKYIYMAIRRGPLAVATDPTKVFALDNSRSSQANANGVVYYSGFPVDMSWFSGFRSSGGNHDVRSRLTGTGRMFSNADTAEAVVGNPIWDTMHGWKHVTSTGTLNTDVVTYMWKRAPGYFDAVAYSGTGSARTVSHGVLGVPPEMMWVKSRSGATPWAVYHKDIGNTKSLRLNGSNVTATENFWNGTTPTADVFTVGANSEVNYPSGRTYIAYLFASAPGVSKVGSYIGTGNDINIDCGFTSGARFVLIKNVNEPEHWILFDSVRGVTSSTSDPYLLPSLDYSERTSTAVDIDPLSSGFKVAGNGTHINGVGDTHIFYAIA